ncbi:MAG: LysR family transcriptional regulator [Myxococcales bacterium]|nr:MAG: LysR family transcriptional regulator [Myxococcales bacterium]
MDLLTQMETFVRVVEGKSLSAAARAQRLSLPAVSRQLRALEDELGATLLVRSTRRLHVTEAGHEWYERSRRVLAEVEDARQAVRGSSGTVSGRLVVSTSLTFGATVIVPRLSKLAETHPGLVIDLRLEDQLVDLVAEGVDIAVRAGSPPPDSTAFVAQPLFSMQRVLVASPRWLRKHGTPRELLQLRSKPCLLQVTLAGNAIPWTLRQRAHPESVPTTVEVSGQLRTNTPTALCSLALQGAGVAYLPDWLVAPHLAEGTLRAVLPAWSSPPHTAWALHRAEHRGNARHRAFLAALPKSSAEL